MTNDNTFLRQKAYSIIQGQILEGKLRAGDFVSELALAQEIGMSRTPVREAIGQLEREGLFTKVPRVGTVVRLPDYNELKDLYEVREAMEGYAATVAGHVLSKEDLDTMARLIDEIHEIAQELKRREVNVLDESMLSRFFNADIAFHLIVIRAAGNKRILDIVSEFRVIQRVFEYDRMAHTLEIIEGAAVQHGEILAALREGDGETARIKMANHIHIAQENALSSFDVAQVEANRHMKLTLPEDVLHHIEKATAPKKKQKRISSAKS